MVVRRWWWRLAVIVNGNRGLGGWVRPFLALAGLLNLLKGWKEERQMSAHTSFKLLST